MSSVGDAIGGVFGGITGANAAADAAENAAGVQAQSGRESIAFQREMAAAAEKRLQPYSQFGQAQLGTLTNLLDPQNQASYLQNNPMFQAALARNETGLKNTLGFQGKRGDLTNAITQNYLATGQQFLQPQINNLFNAANLGQSSAAGQANTALTTGQNVGNTITGIGNAQAAGIVGAGNAQANTFNQLLNTGLTGAAIYGAFSDRRLKKHITRIGTHGPYNVYAWQYRGTNDDIYIGVMADEVEKINPAAVVTIGGFKAVNYGAL